jgi:hypothetical protein
LVRLLEREVPRMAREIGISIADPHTIMKQWDAAVHTYNDAKARVEEIVAREQEEAYRNQLWDDLAAVGGTNPERVAAHLTPQQIAEHQAFEVAETQAARLPVIR